MLVGHLSGLADIPTRWNSIAETHRLLPRPVRALAWTDRAAKQARRRLLQFGAGVAVDLSAKSDFDDLRGFPAHKPFLHGEFCVFS